jgi:hypothetical protein
MNKAHGSPWDRGVWDSYCKRGACPHWVKPGGVYVPRSEMTEEEVKEYFAGFDHNEERGDWEW